MIYVRHCDIYQRIKVQQAVPTRLIERRTIESLTIVADIGCSPQVKQATCVPIRRAGPLHEVEYCSLWKATEKKISKAIEELVQPSALRWKPGKGAPNRRRRLGIRATHPEGESART